MSEVTLTDVAKHFGATVAVEAVNLKVHQGELLALLGPSGCGKTTTLRMIAGFVPVTKGHIHFDDREVTQQPPYRRNIGMVFQNYALFPHLSVEENVAYGLRMRKLAAADIHQRVEQALDWVRVGNLGDRLPKALSGGQQQRVALARALVIQPDVLLLDEPLSNLDAKLRLEVRNEIRRLQQQAGTTSLFVTHDQEEAMAIADRIGVMEAGRLVQIGSAQTLYRRPASRFVAGFIGKCNFFAGQVIAPGCFELKDGTRLAFEGDKPVGAATFCIRPEHLSMTGKPGSAGSRLRATVTALTYLGPVTEIAAITSGQESLLIHLSSSTVLESLAPGQSIELGCSPAQAFVVD